MIAVEIQNAKRRRITIAKLLLVVLVVGVVLGFARSTVRSLPSPRWLGGEIHLGLLIGLLDIPVLPALLIWQIRMSRRPEGPTTGAVVFLIFCYLAWIAGLLLTFRAIFAGIGLV